MIAKKIILALVLCASAAALGEPAEKCYTIENVAGPDGAALEVGGMDWMPDGRLAVCTRRGEVWMGREKEGGKFEWKRFAAGLQEALGILHGESNDTVYVMQRPELTRLVDRDGDGVADRYETVCAAWGFSGNYHEFAYGPVRDREGNFVGSLNLSHHPDDWGGAFMGVAPGTKYRGWNFKVTKDGQFIPWAVGLRSPNGIGVSPDGEIFATDNQGEFVGTGVLYHIQQNHFYGHPSSLVDNKDWRPDPKATTIEELDKRRTKPVVMFPYGKMGQSQSEPRWDTTGGKFGPFAGQIFVGDVQIPILMRCFIEKVGGEWQGACFPFLEDKKLQGANRLLWEESGSLLVGVTDRGWVKGASGIVRVRWTGAVPLEILKMELTPAGFDLTFTKPLDPATAGNPGSYSVLHYHYEYHKQYGSPEMEKTPVKVRKARISEDGRKVSLDLGQVLAGKVYAVEVKGLKAVDGAEVRNGVGYYTVNRLSEP